MDITIFPKPLSGTVSAIPSKSLIHRYLICAAFANRPTEILCADTSQDIEATVACLIRLGAQIIRNDRGYYVTPVRDPVDNIALPCQESGSTLRFLLPVIGALGIHAAFKMKGRLAQRPLTPLLQEMGRMGCCIRWIDENTLSCRGQLKPGEYCIPGNISSQFVSGLLFACALLGRGSHVSVFGNLESKPYVDMTVYTLSRFGIDATKPILSESKFLSPGIIAADGDWSNGAYYLAANTIGSAVQVTGLNPNSSQGDRAITDLLLQMNQHPTIDLADNPDLFPILAIIAAAKNGAAFHHVSRLRHKESDRIHSVVAMLNAIGCHATVSEDSVTVYPGRIHSGTVDACHDHRIVMAAAIAATCADGPVTIRNAESVQKSYPHFWEDYRNLGGLYEQHIR